MALDRIDDIRVFVEIVRAGNLTAAARSLAIEAKQVSRKLARLEESLNVRLVRRTTRRLELTAEGRAFFGHAETLLIAVEEAESRLAVQSRGVAGTVRLLVPTLAVEFGLIDALAEALAAHRELCVDLFVSDDPSRVTDALFDVAVTVGRPTDSTDTLLRLGCIAPILAASRDYLELYGRPTRPAELAEHECLRFRGSRLERHWTLFGPRARQYRVAVGGRFSCTDSRVLLAALHAGMGIGPVHQHALDQAKSHLERVLPRFTAQPFDLFAIVAARQRAVGRIRVTLKVIREVFGTTR